MARHTRWNRKPVLSLWTSGGNANHLNTGRELLPEAGAERTLEAVACTQLFGQGRCTRPNGWTVHALDSHGQSLACLHAPTGDARASPLRAPATSSPPDRLGRWHVAGEQIVAVGCLLQHRVHVVCQQVAFGHQCPGHLGYTLQIVRFG